MIDCGGNVLFGCSSLMYRTQIDICIVISYLATFISFSCPFVLFRTSSTIFCRNIAGRHPFLFLWVEERVSAFQQHDVSWELVIEVLVYVEGLNFHS